MRDNLSIFLPKKPNIIWSKGFNENSKWSNFHFLKVSDLTIFLEPNKSNLMRLPWI
jgi:hypothetical protein